MHIRLDGPGFHALDMERSGVPPQYRGRPHPKLQFSVFVPSADFFAGMRRNQSSLDLANANGVLERARGLEFFTNTTRRQNFLVPPRRHRSFPLVDLTREVTDAWDTKLGKLLSQDKKVYTVTAADYITGPSRRAHPPASSSRRAFPPERPSGVRSCSFGTTRRRTSGPARRFSRSAADRYAPPRCSARRYPRRSWTRSARRAEWDVTAWITSAALANDLKFVILNRSRAGKKSYVNNVYLWIDHD